MNNLASNEGFVKDKLTIEEGSTEASQIEALIGNPEPPPMDEEAWEATINDQLVVIKPYGLKKTKPVIFGSASDPVILTLSQRIELGGEITTVANLFFRNYGNEQLNPPKPLYVAGRFPIYPDDRIIVCGGPPGSGKTALWGGQTALDLIAQGCHVIICNYEMRQQGSFQRLIANASYRTDTPIEASAIIQRTANLSTMMEVYNQEVHKKPGTLSLIRPGSPAELEKTLRPLRDAYPNDRIVVIYDYLQRMPWFDDINEPRIATKKTFRAIQEIGNHYECHSVSLASLNRGGYGKADMGGYKECGEIESDADVAIILTFAKQDDHGNTVSIELPEEIIEVRRQPEVTLLVNVVKQRNGMETRYELDFIKKYQAFVDNAPADVVAKMQKELDEAEKRIQKGKLRKNAEEEQHGKASNRGDYEVPD